MTTTSQHHNSDPERPRARRIASAVGITGAALLGGLLLPPSAWAAPDPGTPTAAKVSTRGEISYRSTLKVAAPAPGQVTIVRLIVASATTPRIGVATAVNSTGMKRVTAVAGSRLLTPARAGGLGTYGITVPILKPRGAGATNAPAALAITVLGSRLRILSKAVYANTTTTRVRGEMCQWISPFDVGHKQAKARVAFANKLFFGAGLTGFKHAQYLGTFAVLQACQGKAPQSYLNALRGTRTAAANTKASGAAVPRVTLSQQSAGNTGAQLNPSTDAVLLVSGFMSQTPFTTPTQACSAPGMSAGGTWSVMRDALIAAGYPVYTAPETTYNYVNGQPQPTAITPASMGLGTCAATQLPASMTLNTLGDFDLNSSILAGFLNYLHTNYGIQRVWLVGHSDGGLWSRGAMDYASSMSGVQIQSVTTIDTPWTGSFLANLGKRELANNCAGYDVVCRGYVDALTYLADYLDAGAAEGLAFPEMTSTSMAKWNLRMAGVPGQTPFYAASSIGLNDPKAFGIFGAVGASPFTNPNDIAVGIASQQAQGLLSNGTISRLSCFATIPGIHLSLPTSVTNKIQDVDLMNTYPGSTTPVTQNSMTVTNVQNVLTGQPPSAACPSAGYQQSGQYAPGQFGPWPDDAPDN